MVALHLLSMKVLVCNCRGLDQRYGCGRGNRTNELPIGNRRGSWESIADVSKIGQNVTEYFGRFQNVQNIRGKGKLTDFKMLKGLNNF